MMISVTILAVFGFYRELIGDGKLTSTETCSEIALNATKLSSNDTGLINLAGRSDFLENMTLPNVTDVMEDRNLSASLKIENEMCASTKIPSGLRILAFIGLVCFVCAYSFSFGPITWVLLSEIFPASIKGRAMALATALNWAGNTFVSGTFITATGKKFKIHGFM